MKISMDGKGRYQDNVFVERLWRTVKYEEVYQSLHQRPGSPEGAGRLLPVLQRDQALDYRTLAEVFHGEQGAVAGESNGRRCSPEERIESMAGESGFSLNSALILSN